MRYFFLLTDFADRLIQAFLLMLFFASTLQLHTNTDGSLIILLVDSSKINGITSSIVFFPVLVLLYKEG